MASLFKNNVLQEQLALSIVPKFEERIRIVKQWHAALTDKSLLKKTETQCEQAFNDDFFVKILGYTRFPSEKYTIEVKAAVETAGGQKPDAALGIFTPDGNAVQCVCEIKDANTSLDKPQQREGNLTPVQQGFKYKPLYKNCGFVIVTNFREIRLYRDTLHDYERFTLTELADPADNYSNFRKFHYLLSADHFIAESGKSNTEELLAAIRIEQEEITKRFYKQYHELRLQLIDNILKNNKSISFDVVLEKAQKIIDRIVFTSFCEDLGMLPENKLAELVQKSETIGLGFPIWNIMKEYFLAVDRGNLKMDIPPDGYNGELFKPDTVLDSLVVDDNICREFVRLGRFDFDNDLTATILGHIFEQSITDIEELKDQRLEDAKKTFSKRRKDGIYYTPEYIVDFIVSSTLGKHFEELEANMLKKQGLKEDITDSHYTKRAIDAYNEYLEAISKITILDLACGSGAFLVKVFDYLKKEHERVGQILAELTGKTSLLDSEGIIKTLLRQNIFGVDLNAESVEITKLSLWLKTAEKGKRLEELKENIKCGNSLIDDSTIDRRAFNWQKEFKGILDSGGFDVIVGNPPYVGEKGNKDIFQLIHQGEWGSKFYHRKMDLFYFFFHRGLDLLKDGGRLGFITTNYFITADGAINLRRDIRERAVIEKIANFGEIKIFEDAKGQHNMITILQKGQKPQLEAYSIDFHEKNLSLPEALNITSVMRDGVNISYVKQKDLYDGEERYIRISGISKDGANSKNVILDKIQMYGEPLENMCHINMGVQSGADFVGNTLLQRAIEKHYVDKQYLEQNKIEVGDNIYIVDSAFLEELPRTEKEILKPFIKNSDISQYYVPSHFTNYYIYIDSQVDINNYPTIKQHLLKYRPILRAREQVGDDEDSWYWIRGSKRKYLINSGQHLICPYRSKKNIFALTDGNIIGAGDVYYITKKNDLVSLKYLLTILNSQLCFFWLKNRGKKKGEILELYQKPLSEIPIKELADPQQKPFIEKADAMIQLNKKLNENMQKVVRLIIAEYGIEQWPSKIDYFWGLSFDDFLKALKLKNVPLQKKQELMEYFEKQKAESSSIADQIETLQREIDEMVCDVYGLTQEERKIIQELAETA
ncbi:MAG: DNA methyltransferase [Candidatus Peribacteraceae bacterium]